MNQENKSLELGSFSWHHLQKLLFFSVLIHTKKVDILPKPLFINDHEEIETLSGSQDITNIIDSILDFVTLFLKFDLDRLQPP